MKNPNKSPQKGFINELTGNVAQQTTVLPKGNAKELFTNKPKPDGMKTEHRLSRGTSVKPSKTNLVQEQTNFISERRKK